MHEKYLYEQNLFNYGKLKFKNTIVIDLYIKLPITSDYRIFPKLPITSDFFRFLPISSDLFRFLPISSENIFRKFFGNSITENFRIFSETSETSENFRIVFIYDIFIFFFIKSLRILTNFISCTFFYRFN